jgi:hypothetical protein
MHKFNQHRIKTIPTYNPEICKTDDNTSNILSMTRWNNFNRITTPTRRTVWKY